MDALTPASPPTPAGLRIARATPLDADTLSDLIHELAVFERLEAQCRITPEAVERHLIGPLRSAEALVAWIEDAPVGFAVYYRTFSTFAARPGAFIEDLYVRERFRHRGIGRALLTAVARIAHRSNAGRLEWNTLKWNENARRFYSSAGAKEMDDWLLLRMETPEIGAFACACDSGKPSAACGCGGKGPHHAANTG
jgi:GNAT superfamily N-acetyltransferase